MYKVYYHNTVFQAVGEPAITQQQTTAHVHNRIQWQRSFLPAAIPHPGPSPEYTRGDFKSSNTKKISVEKTTYVLQK